MVQLSQIVYTFGKEFHLLGILSFFKFFLVAFGWVLKNYRKTDKFTITEFEFKYFWITNAILTVGS